MKTTFLIPFKSFSRTVVHDDQADDHQDHNKQKEQQYDSQNDVVGACTSLTVWRKSLLMSCNGFTVIDSNGNLIYRVDNYMGFRPEEITLMDGSGKSILTLMHRRTKLGLVDSWLVYEGERLDHNKKIVRRSKSLSSSSSTSTSKKPIFYVRKNINLLINGYKSHVLAYVFRGSSSDERSSSSSSSRANYVIEGSYSQRSCKVLDKWSNNKVVAEIKRKEECVGGVSFGAEVFQLIVQPGFDPTFAMAFVLLLDQMFS
ncbi:protein LURP-one-related 17-like [Humulus lupulus]|uniref:protein LURP-one-related 17-like n=1 Tax=Humulus lupulus TaxID=3486 RepID=UPI002B405A93|nr:protein LURP-one-related 17-like [Humulus lupulus]